MSSALSERDAGRDLQELTIGVRPAGAPTAPVRGRVAGRGADSCSAVNERDAGRNGQLVPIGRFFYWLNYKLADLVHDWDFEDDQS